MTSTFYYYEPCLIADNLSGAQVLEDIIWLEFRQLRHCTCSQRNK